LKDRAATEMGLFWMAYDMQLRGTLLASTAGDKGAQASFVYMRDEFGLSFDALKTWAGKDMGGSDENPLASLTQVTARASYTFDAELTLGMRANYSIVEDAPRTLTYGPFAEWRIWQEGESDLSLTADVSRNNGNYEGSALLRFTKRFGDYGVTGTAGSAFGRPDNGPTGMARAWRDSYDADETLLMGTTLSGDKVNQTLSADADYRNTIGQVRGSAQKAWGQGGSTFSYGGNFYVNAAQLGSEVHVGGTHNDNSAIIIETDGDVDVPMKIFINSVEKSVVTVGDKQVIYLPPFHVYRVRIAQKQGGLLDFESGDRMVTLYPGNVAKLHWTVNKFYVLAGDVVTPDGDPVAGALINGSKAQDSTDEFGSFQVEMSQQKQMTFTMTDLNTCVVDLPQDVKPVNGVLIYHDNLVCKPVMPVSQNASR
jgi:hypothetical protein